MDSKISTYSGILFNVHEPNFADVRIEDIAHALANQTRFTGHCRFRYSVAEHSVRVSELVEVHSGLVVDQIWGLLHDASEAYLTDLPTPLKQCSALGEPYRALERAVQGAICTHFGLNPVEPACVKAADRRLLSTEIRDLMPAKDVYWREPNRAAPLKERIRPWSADVAEWEFLRRYCCLTGDVRGLKEWSKKP